MYFSSHIKIKISIVIEIELENEIMNSQLHMVYYGIGIRFGFNIFYSEIGIKINLYLLKLINIKFSYILNTI